MPEKPSLFIAPAELKKQEKMGVQRKAADSACGKDEFLTLKQSGLGLHINGKPEIVEEKKS